VTSNNFEGGIIRYFALFYRIR